MSGPGAGVLWGVKAIGLAVGAGPAAVRALIADGAPVARLGRGPRPRLYAVADDLAAWLRERARRAPARARTSSRIRAQGRTPRRRA